MECSAPATTEDEQKPAWSEEDERHKNTIIRAIHGAGNITPIDGELAEKWLKSNKDRVQPKQEWNEEDSYMLGQAIKCVNNSGKLDVSTEEIEYWLKSLKNRVQPQREWSEEDEEMLKNE